MISVSFQHWCHIFSDTALIRYGSPHFDRHSAGQALRQEVASIASRVEDVLSGFLGGHSLCDGVDAAQQPLQSEIEAGLSPLLQPHLHRFAGVWPLGTILARARSPLGELHAAAIDAIEDVHHDIDRLVLPGDLLDMQVNVLNGVNGIEPVNIDGQSGQ